MKLYALGTLELFDGIYDISTVAMTIFQPRRRMSAPSRYLKNRFINGRRKTDIYR